MRLVDMIPYVLFALKTNGQTNQTLLTHFVAGESGRGSPKLTRILFPELEAKGYIASNRYGRSTRITITQRGEEHYAARPLTPKDEEWMRNFMADVVADAA